jgi:hypothetical protein
MLFNLRKSFIYDACDALIRTTYKTESLVSLLADKLLDLLVVFLCKFIYQFLYCHYLLLGSLVLQILKLCFAHLIFKYKTCISIVRLLIILKPKSFKSLLVKHKKGSRVSVLRELDLGVLA